MGVTKANLNKERQMEGIHFKLNIIIDRYNEIDRENKILLNKMTKIMERNSINGGSLDK